MPFFEQTRAGELVSRLTADVQTLTTFTRLVLVEVVGSVLLFVVSIAILVWLSPLLSLVMLVSVPVLVWSSLRYGKRSRPAFLALRDRVADTMSSLQEGLAGVRVVQSFGQETDRYSSYRKTVERAGLRLAAHLTRQHRLLPGNRIRAVARARRRARCRRLPRAARNASRSGRSSRSRCTSSRSSTRSPGSATGSASSSPAGRRSPRSRRCSRSRSPCPAAPRRCPSPERWWSRTSPLPTARLRRRSTAFRSESSPASRSRSSARPAPGSRALAKLLVRAYDPNAGRVTYGGVDLRSAQLDELRRRIMFVPQEGHLFSGTIAENIRLARPDATDEETLDALRADRRARTVREPARTASRPMFGLVAHGSRAASGSSYRWRESPSRIRR